MRVLTIGHSYVVASNRATVARLAEQNDIDMTVAAPKFFKGDLRSIECEPNTHEGIDLVELPAFATGWIHGFYYSGLSSLMKRKPFDLVHVWEEPYIFAGYQIAKQCVADNIPYFFRTAQSISKSYPPPFRNFENFVVKNAAGWVAGGQLVYRNLCQRGYPAAKGQVITLAVDKDQFRPFSPEKRNAAREAFGWDKPTIGYIGRLAEEKGLDCLMAALEKVPQPWQLVALGSGDYKQRLLEWAAARGFGDSVHVELVTHDEVPEYLPLFDMMVAPSLTTPQWKEQFGRMLIEAFACGVPVIGSDSGEIPHVIDEAGLVVKEGDSAALATAITTLLQDHDLRAHYATTGHQRFMTNYDASAVAKRFRSFYDSVANSSR